MAGTVVLDDVELREAQRDYLDFLDDEVRGSPGPGSGAWSPCFRREAAWVVAPSPSSNRAGN